MEILSNLALTPLGVAGFICGAVLLYLVISRTMKKRNDP